MPVPQFKVSVWHDRNKGLAEHLEQERYDDAGHWALSSVVVIPYNGYFLEYQCVWKMV